MNWQAFGIFGYLSVVLAVGTVLLCFVQWRRPARNLARAAMLMAVLAYACAKVNSVTHVNRIEVDPAEQLAIAKAREEQRRQAALESRGGEVADIRFAEDAEGEFYDRAGMDEADLKYLEGADSEAPEWRKRKRGRGEGKSDDDSLEGMIGAKEQSEGAGADAVVKETKPAILMSSGDKAIANRLDRWNLATGMALVFAGLLVLAVDYLRRANIYREATLPLPLPGSLLNAVTPMPAMVARPHPPRRDLAGELAWLLKRGESFIFFAASREEGDGALARLGQFTRGGHGADLIRISEDAADITDEFIFDALWHGRASFVIEDAARTGRLLDSFLRLLAERRKTRARAPHTFHLVWNREGAIMQPVRDRLVSHLGAVGGSLFLLQPAPVS